MSSRIKYTIHYERRFLYQKYLKKIILNIKMTSFENLHDDAICEIIEKLDDYNDVMNLLSTRLYFIKDKDFFIKCWINSRKPFTLRSSKRRP